MRNFEGPSGYFGVGFRDCSVCFSYSMLDHDLYHFFMILGQFLGSFWETKSTKNDVYILVVAHCSPFIQKDLKHILKYVHIYIYIYIYIYHR